jgi:Peptidase family M23
VRVIDRRTTALGAALVAAVAAAGAIASSGGASPGATVPRLIFPVVGPVTYHDDFGEPRAKWPHPGNDLLAARRAIAVAAEAGKIKFWTRSSTAGCMLYLYGRSGTTYQYIHLNNDLTSGNDNRGTCVAGTAYASGLRDGTSVQAGQPVGFVGDSGDANGIHAHLHFEVHPKDGDAVDPYPFLGKALHLLFPVDRATNVTISAEGSVASVTGDRLSLKIAKLLLLPGGSKAVRLGRPLVVEVPETTQIDTGASNVSTPDPDLLGSLVGQSVAVLTAPTLATLEAALARPGVWNAARISLLTAPSSTRP